MDGYKITKLVRDKIPEKIRRNGEIPDYRQATPAEMPARLGNKSVEEAKELRRALRSLSKVDVIEEVADQYELLETIMEKMGISQGEVRQEQARKRAELGGFSKGWILNIL